MGGKHRRQIPIYHGKSKLTVKPERAKRGLKWRPHPSLMFEPAPEKEVGNRMFQLFGSRVDTFGEQYSVEGGALWRRVDEPLTVEVLQEHLDGKRTVGVYVINPADQSCKLICFDFDSKISGITSLDELKKEVDKLIAVLEKGGIPKTAILREFSGSKGIHVWVFFNPPIPAIVAYHLGRNAAQQAGVKCEVFPKQRQLLSPFGNLVKLPCGIHQATKDRCRIYNEKWEPVEPDYLFKLEPVVVDHRHVEEIKRRLLAEEKGWMDRVVDTGLPYEGEDPPCVAKYLSGVGVTIGQRHDVLLRLTSYLLRFKGVEAERVAHIIREWNKCNQPPLEADRLEREIEAASKGPYNFGCQDEYWRRHCDIKACPLKKKQLPILLGQLTQEEIDEAEKLLRDPDLLKKFDVMSDKWIAEDYPTRRILLRTYCSAFTDDPINQALFGRDSIGKTYNAVTAANIIQSEKIWFLGGLSPTAFVYDYGDYDKTRGAYVVDLTGVTMLFLDAPHADTLAKLRPVLSHDKHEIMFRVTQKTKGGMLKTLRCIVRGWPAVVECAAQTGHGSGEFSSRFLTTTPEISKEKTKKGAQKLADRVAKPKQFRFDSKEPRIWAAAYRLLQEEAPITVRIPFAPALVDHLIIRGPETMRFFGMLLRLMKANAALHIRQRKKDEEGCLIAKRQDFEQAVDDFEKVAATSFFGVSGDALQLYNNLKGRKDLTYEAIEEAAREVFGAETPENTIRSLYIKRLVQSGLLIEKSHPTDKRRTIYDASTKPADIAVFTDKEAVKKIIIQQEVDKSASSDP